MFQVCLSPYSNTIPNHSLYLYYQRPLGCFPQMKPEAVGQQHEVEPSYAEASEEKASEDEEIIDDETMVLNLLKEKSPVDLNELKGQTGLSNKKWDKAIKGLTGNGLAKVVKDDGGLWVELVG
ncbi:MAG: hypothetical protein K9H49_03860 [Bacteroidales bacterium]|nr:hypothetical protein [Bacteroidales bacterium]MCF8389426.1 hypothetical protein [Bacteroidales bacterium]